MELGENFDIENYFKEMRKGHYVCVDFDPDREDFPAPLSMPIDEAIKLDREVEDNFKNDMGNLVREFNLANSYLGVSFSYYNTKFYPREYLFFVSFDNEHDAGIFMSVVNLCDSVLYKAWAPEKEDNFWKRFKIEKKLFRE